LMTDGTIVLDANRRGPAKEFVDVKGLRDTATVPSVRRREPSATPAGGSLVITLNGDRYEVPAPLTIAELLSRLEIDSRRVAVEHNLLVVRRATFTATVIGDGDTIEIVNFVGGG